MKYLNKKALKQDWKILSASFTGFNDDRGLKLSASLAYYTVFSIAPLLIMMISMASFFAGAEAVQGKVFSEINGFVGNDAAKQIQEIIKNASLKPDTKWWGLVAGVITLFIGATTVFLEIQDSINMIWRVRAKPKRGWLQMIKNRFLSFSLIISLGFLSLVSLLISGLVSALRDYLVRHFPDVTVVLIDAINFVITFLVIAFLFGIIFKFLPDVKIKWKDVRIGALFTAVLFIIGKYLIGLYIETTGTASTYGAAGSIVVILVWIYYTSAILYFGAEFTQVYTEYTCGVIEPADYAVHVEQVEKERKVSELPPQNPELANQSGNSD
ncbi:MAG: hypothetical protein K0S09_1017 [Sphingobacteriaceae bacterium]|jgi:membrane protein|nr:hypothetical protein [Sphingobacteriaceae bacterium]